MQMLFDGQQSDEKVLYVVRPHPLTRKLAIVRNTLLSLFFFAVIVGIAQVTTIFAGVLILVGFLACLVFLGVSLWWNQVVYDKDRAYITDRRIIRFAVLSPFFRTKRALFWNEALKAKAFSPNMVYKMLNIGALEVEPILGEGENVRINDVYYYEDLGNYIDKILYIVKNKKEDLDTLKPFVPKPKGKRD